MHTGTTPATHTDLLCKVRAQTEWRSFSHSQSEQLLKKKKKEKPSLVIFFPQCSNPGCILCWGPRFFVWFFGFLFCFSLWGVTLCWQESSSREGSRAALQSPHAHCAPPPGAHTQGPPGWAGSAGAGNAGADSAGAGSTGLFPSNLPWAWLPQGQSPHPPRETLSGWIFPNALILNVRRLADARQVVLQLQGTTEVTRHQPPTSAPAPTADAVGGLGHGGSAVDDGCSPFGYQDALIHRQQDEEEEGSIPSQ